MVVIYVCLIYFKGKYVFRFVLEVYLKCYFREIFELVIGLILVEFQKNIFSFCLYEKKGKVQKVMLIVCIRLDDVIGLFKLEKFKFFVNENRF